ncbi:MAG: hypothetical protein EB023_01170 [Flavobacteriia bacterium]|nr:hypothetical protein [Flavobacteriia bacterium]
MQNNRKQRAIKGLFVFLFFMGLVIYFKPSEPYATGDGIEYVLTTEAWYNHRSPDIRYSDFCSFKADFVAHQSWQSNYKKAAFDEVGAFVKDNTSQRKEYGGFYRNSKGNVYGYHFVFYSLVNVPSRALTAMMNIHPIKAFLYTNLFLCALLLALILFSSKSIPWAHLLFFGVVFFSGFFYYQTWTHPEVITVVLVSSGMVFLLDKRFHAAMCCVALATLQNQPLLFLLLWFFGYIVYAHKFNLKPLLPFFLYALVFLIPSLYFYTLFGTTSLIKDAGYLSFTNCSLNRVFGFFFDLNQGMVLSLGLWLVFYVVLLLVRAVKVVKHKEWSPWDFIPLVVLAMTVLVSAMSNWNHGMAIVNRYAVWIQIPIIFHAILLIEPLRIIPKATLIGAGLSSQILLLAIHRPLNQFDWSNLQHMPLAKWMLDHYPKFYNPDPQIFIARTHQVFDFSRQSSPVCYFNDKNELTKIAVHKDKLDTLTTFGYPLEAIEHQPRVRSGQEEWVYINDFSSKSTKSSKSILALIQQSEIARILSEMKNNPQWMEELNKKALANQHSLTQQMELDARFIFNERHHLP